MNKTAAPGPDQQPSVMQTAEAVAVEYDWSVKLRYSAGNVGMPAASLVSENCHPSHQIPRGTLTPCHPNSETWPQKEPC